MELFEFISSSPGWGRELIIVLLSGISIVIPMKILIDSIMSGISDIIRTWKGIEK